MELANTFPDVIKPVIDVAWFTYQTYILLGARNTAYLYLYMVAGLGFLRVVTPNFDTLVKKTQELEGVYRYDRLSDSPELLMTWYSRVPSKSPIFFLRLSCQSFHISTLGMSTLVSAPTLSPLPSLVAVLVRVRSSPANSTSF